MFEYLSSSQFLPSLHLQYIVDICLKPSVDFEMSYITWSAMMECN